MKTVAARITGSNFQQAEELREERAEILAWLKDICDFITDFRGRRDGFGKKEKS